MDRFDRYLEIAWIVLAAIIPLVGVIGFALMAFGWLDYLAKGGAW